MHARVSWSGVVTRLCLAPANIHEGAVVFELTQGATGLLLGDRKYWLSVLKENLQRLGAVLVTPKRTAERV